LCIVLAISPLTPQKVRAYLAANPSSAQTLEQLLAHEKTSVPKASNRTATIGLQWLLRGLKFTARGLRINLTNPDEELSVSFRKGYEDSLKPHHGMLVRPVFSVSPTWGVLRFACGLLMMSCVFRAYAMRRRVGNRARRQEV
jgi:hypothetical protein